MMTIKTKYNFFDMVQLKIDAEKKKRMVVGISVRPQGITYALSTIENESWHFEKEIERVKKPVSVKGFKPSNK